MNLLVPLIYSSCTAHTPAKTHNLGLIYGAVVIISFFFFSGVPDGWVEKTSQTLIFLERETMGPHCFSLIRVVNSAGAVKLIAVVPSFRSRPVERHHWSKMEKRGAGKYLSVPFSMRSKKDS